MVGTSGGQESEVHRHVWRSLTLVRTVPMSAAVARLRVPRVGLGGRPSGHRDQRVPQSRTSERARHARLSAEPTTGNPTQ